MSRQRAWSSPSCASRWRNITRDVVLAALATRQRFQISYWDAAILEAARSLGCDTVLSEDLGDGQDYAGVVVENPFSVRGEG